LDTVKTFAQKWEALEEKNLNIEIKRRIKTIRTDTQYKKVNEAQDNEEIEKRLEQEGNSFVTSN